jgi:hypothetical protein
MTCASPDMRVSFPAVLTVVAGGQNWPIRPLGTGEYPQFPHEVLSYPCCGCFYRTESGVRVGRLAADRLAFHHEPGT